MRDLAAIYREHFFVETVQVNDNRLIIGHTWLAGADTNKVFVLTEKLIKWRKC